MVWISFSGLGNKILTLASTFLYALLTNRVLLVDRGVDMADLFCEPFPEMSWLLPLDFPIANQFNNFDKNSPHSYGNMVKNITLANSNPPFVYLHLSHEAMTIVTMISFSSVTKIKLFFRRSLG